MNALLRRFIQLIEAELAPAGFVRRGPVFRYFDEEGNGIALDIQRTTALRAEVEFFVNVGVLLAVHLRYTFGADDPRRDAMPYDGIWRHRLTATDDTAELPDHRFSLSTEGDAERVAGIVRAWLVENLPRMRSWLGDFDAMLASIEQDRERSARASAEQLASGRWKAGRWPDGHWNEGIVRAYAHAAHGDVDAIVAETADWYDTGPDSLAADALAVARHRLAEQQA